MILMLAPGPKMTFGAMPSGATYLSDQYALVKIANDSAADQSALQNAGCYTLTPFGGWGSATFATLADLYSADAASGLILPDQTGFPLHMPATVTDDGDNTGTWAKTSTGIGSGHWIQVSTDSYVNLTAQVSAADGYRQRAQNSLQFDLWADLAAATGMAAGDRAAVAASDTGTHTDPVAGGTVDNSGVFEYSASPAGWERVNDLDSALAAGSASAASSSAAAAAAVTADTHNPNLAYDPELEYSTAGDTLAWGGGVGSMTCVSSYDAKRWRTPAATGLLTQPVARAILASALPNQTLSVSLVLANKAADGGGDTPSLVRIYALDASDAIISGTNFPSSGNDEPGGQYSRLIPAGAIGEPQRLVVATDVDVSALIAAGAVKFQIAFRKYNTVTWDWSYLCLRNGGDPSYRPLRVSAKAVADNAAAIADAGGVLAPEVIDNIAAQLPNLFTAGELDTTVALRRDTAIPNSASASTYSHPSDGVLPCWALTVGAGASSEYATQLGPFDAADVFDADGNGSFSLVPYSLDAYSGANTGVVTRVLVRQYNSSNAEITGARQTITLASEPATTLAAGVPVRISGFAKDPACVDVRIYIGINNAGGATARTLKFGRMLLRKGKLTYFRRPPVIIPSAGSTYWAATDGSGSNPGTYSSPMTLTQAWLATRDGGGIIRIKPGTYDLAASLDPTGRTGLTKLVGEQGSVPDYDGWPALRRIHKFTGISRVAGYTEVCQAVASGLTDVSLLNWLMRWGMADPRADAQILDADRDPLHRGLTNRLSWGTRMLNGDYADLASAKAGIEGSMAAGAPMCWKDNGTATFYFPVEDGTDVATITAGLEESVGLFAAATARRCGEIEMYGLDIYGGANMYPFTKAVLDEVHFRGARENCCEGGFVDAGKIRGAASGSAPTSLRAVGDIFNGHRGAKWTVDEMTGFCSHDDVCSLHEGCTINVRAALTEYAGGSSFAIAYGCDAFVANAISRKAQQIAGRKTAAFLSLGAPDDEVNTGGYADLGADTNVRLQNCIDYGSTVSFAGQDGSSAALMTAIDCRSFDPVTRGFQYARLIDCGGSGNGLLNTGCTITPSSMIT